MNDQALDKENSPEYEVKVTFSIGTACGSMVWTTRSALTPDLLEELIDDIKDELGTSKDVFINRIDVSDVDKSPIDKYLKQIASINA